MHVKVQLLLQGGVDNIYPAFDIAICSILDCSFSFGRLRRRSKGGGSPQNIKSLQVIAQGPALIKGPESRHMLTPVSNARWSDD